MKKIMMIAAMMVAVLSANAQNEVGQVTLKPMVGLNLATLTGLNDNKVSSAWLRISVLLLVFCILCREPSGLKVMEH